MYGLALTLVFFSIATAEKMPVLSFFIAVISFFVVAYKKDLTNNK